MQILMDGAQPILSLVDKEYNWWFTEQPINSNINNKDYYGDHLTKICYTPEMNCQLTHAHKSLT